jgi:hypothetical protein
MLSAFRRLQSATPIQRTPVSLDPTPSAGTTALEARLARLERRVRVYQRGALFIAAALVAYACATVPQAAADAGPATPDVLRVRGLVIVDDQGRDRISIGAPWPAPRGRTSALQGVGMLIVDTAGVDRLNVASPAPGPPGGGERIAVANGVTWYDGRGNERGGIGYLDNGRSVMMLDNNHGEGAGVFSFDNGYVGMGVLREGQFRALMQFDPDSNATSLVLSDEQGRPRARLSVGPDGAPALTFLDAAGNPLAPRE